MSDPCTLFEPLVCIFNIFVRLTFLPRSYQFPFVHRQSVQLHLSYSCVSSALLGAQAVDGRLSALGRCQLFLRRCHLPRSSSPSSLLFPSSAASVPAEHPCKQSLQYSGKPTFFRSCASWMGRSPSCSSTFSLNTCTLLLLVTFEEKCDTVWMFHLLQVRFDVQSV